MTSPLITIGCLGGIAQVSTLLRAGASERSIRTAVKNGQLGRIRKGWVHTADAPADAVRAVKLGGRLACISAARHHGLWTPDGDTRLHLARPAHAGRTYGELGDAVEHWQSVPWYRYESPIESVAALVRQVLLCCCHEDALTIVDSALNQHKLAVCELARIVRSLPPRFAWVLDEVDLASESGLETLCRVRLARLGLSIRSQVQIEGVGRVDLLLGDRLVIEADGKTWHDGTAAFHADRSRDLTLVRLGYRVIRLSYEQIVHGWPLVDVTLRTLISREEHRWSNAHRRHGLAN